MVATLGAAAVFACRPHPGLGRVTLERGAKQHTIDLATCLDTATRRPPRPRMAPFVSPDGRLVAFVRVRRTRGATRGAAAIEVRDRSTGKARVVLRVPESYRRAPQGVPGPLGLVGWSPDGRWLFFFVDPYGSASIAADGLLLQVVALAGGTPRKLTTLLLYRDYHVWCGGRLVLTAGFDRIATHHKRLVVTGPPGWKLRPLVLSPGCAWGAATCAPDGRSLAVQSQPESDDGNFFHTRWALWRVGLDGSERRLTQPPAGYADESPLFSRDGGTLMFVRSHKGFGKLYALRGGRLVGPLLSLGYSLGYYGAQDWWGSARWSLAARQ